MYLIFAGIALLLSLFFFGKTISTSPTKVAKRPNGAMPMQSQQIEAASFESIKINALAKISPAQKTTIIAVENQNKPQNIDSLKDIWHKLGNKNMEAKYIADKAKLENSEKSLTFATQNYLDLLNAEQNAPIKMWQANQAVELLNKVIDINPNNDAAKITLAGLYSETTGETMKGVQMLLDITRTNPNNVPASILLGKLAVQSQQWDKAIARLENLVAKNPTNSEAKYFLAEAYKGKGNTAKAKELFNECKKIVNNPNFTKEIDNYIKLFKKIL